MNRASYSNYNDHVQKVYDSCIHDSMLGKLLEIMSKTLDVSGVEDEHDRKRQKNAMTAKTLSATQRVVKARFALGNDDGAYLRTNIMPLQTVIVDTNYRLSTKMTMDMQNATFLGLLDAYDKECRARLQAQETEIEAVVTTLSWLLSIKEVNDYVLESMSHPILCKVARTRVVMERVQNMSAPLNTYTNDDINGLAELFQIVTLLFATTIQTSVQNQLNKTEEASNDARSKIKSLMAVSQPADLVQAVLDSTSGKAQKDRVRPLDVHAVYAYLKADSSDVNNIDPYIAYALARGLCSRRPPHHESTTEDEKLLYNLPQSACPTMQQLYDLACSTGFGDNSPMSDTLEQIDTTDDFCDFEEQQQTNAAKWAPVLLGTSDIDDSEESVNVAVASVTEHLVAYYKRMALTEPDKDRRLSLLAHAAATKIRQLKSLFGVFNIERAKLNELCNANEFQTVPVKKDGGDSILFAPNAGLIRIFPGEEAAKAAEKAAKEAAEKAAKEAAEKAAKEAAEAAKAETEAREEKEARKRQEAEKTLETLQRSEFGTSAAAPDFNTELTADVTAYLADLDIYISAPLDKVEDYPRVQVRSMPPYRALPKDNTHANLLSPENIKNVFAHGINVMNKRLQILKDCEATEKARKSFNDLQLRGLNEESSAIDQIARSRREEVWNDSMREAAISGDRLYAFVRQLSGVIHESVDSVCVVDESMLVKQQKDRQADSKRLSMMAAQQHMQLVSNVFRGVINESGLTLGIDDKKGLDGELKVVSNTLRKQVSELTSGSSSSEGFFTNSVKLENLLAQGTGEMTLSGLFTRLRDVGLALQDAAVHDVNDGLNPNGPSLDFLSSPRNSLILRWKPEAHAALRTAFDTFQREMNTRHRMMGTLNRHRKISAYELIEGRNDELSMAFATYCAHTLAHQRMFSAGQAAYMSQWGARANMAAKKFSLDKLISVACEYVSDTERPEFVHECGWEWYFGVRNDV